MGGGDAISVQELRRKTHKGRKEEDGERVKMGGYGAASSAGIAEV